jgi:hypothetical protein
VAGYSGTPLVQKLGVKPGMAVHGASAPEGFRDLLAPLPAAVTWKHQLRAPLDLVVAFFTRTVDVTRRWPKLTTAVGPAGVIWVAWPKRSSGVATDLTEQTFRDLLLPTGWVDVKVAAIDDTWSGLKFVRRKELRCGP